MKYIKEYNKYIDPYQEEDWEVEEEPEFITWLKRNYPDESKWDKITDLSCNNNNFNILEGIERLTGLEYLDCRGNDIDSLEGIEKLKNLKVLYCDFNNITSVDNIYDLKLTEFGCSHNNINIIDIGRIKDLDMLWCYNSNIGSLEGIEKLKKLEFIYCDNNNLKTLEGIEELNNLRLISCHNNDFSKEYIDYIIKYCIDNNIMLNM